ncbi:MAG: ABC transporter ATP-binding protein [candidate division KSB1 bacterium]|nr:ABC transporter ATP-binding protein [candidate division KSB1 bacterium]MDZ7317651.1 ABC transporter ATP-binding protein [candidate division KSB1 bacterium]
MVTEIEISHLKKSFGTTAAVVDLNLEVHAGEMMGLIGPDGAGKTTTLRILCGLLIADAGECWLGGKNVRTELAAVRSFIGYMPQRFSLYPDLTVAENLRFFADLFQVAKAEREKRLQRLLEFSRLGPFANRRAAALSGGMKQKLALSCTLIHTPKILLLDEPTTGVDPVSRREFWDILNELLATGVTILVTTPYMDEAARCDRVAFIHEGKMLITTEPDKIPVLYPNTLVEIQCDHNVRAAMVLRTSEQFASVQCFGDRVHLSAKQPLAEIQSQVNQLLAAASIQVFGIKKISANIEDVFVELLK